MIKYAVSLFFLFFILTTLSTHDKSDGGLGSKFGKKYDGVISKDLDFKCRGHWWKHRDGLRALSLDPRRVYPVVIVVDLSQSATSPCGSLFPIQAMGCPTMTWQTVIGLLTVTVGQNPNRNLILLHSRGPIYPYNTSALYPKCSSCNWYMCFMAWLCSEDPSCTVTHLLLQSHMQQKEKVTIRPADWSMFSRWVSHSLPEGKHSSLVHTTWSTSVICSLGNPNCSYHVKENTVKTKLSFSNACNLVCVSLFICTDGIITIH